MNRTSRSRRATVKARSIATHAAGRSHAGRRMRDCTRFTPMQVGLIVLTYKPRKPAYRIVAARLALAA